MIYRDVSDVAVVNIRGKHCCCCCCYTICTPERFVLLSIPCADDSDRYLCTKSPRIYCRCGAAGRHSNATCADTVAERINYGRGSPGIFFASSHMREHSFETTSNGTVENPIIFVTRENRITMKTIWNRLRNYSSERH